MTAPRRRRRAVGPPGARPAGDEQPDALLREPEAERPVRDDAAEEQRLRADRPPHHDRGV